MHEAQTRCCGAPGRAARFIYGHTERAGARRPVSPPRQPPKMHSVRKVSLIRSEPWFRHGGPQQRVMAHAGTLSH